MTPVTYILLAVIVAVILIDLYLKRKNKLATTKEIEKVVDKENPEKKWWKRIWVKFKLNKKILIVISLIILIITFFLMPHFVEKAFENGSYEKAISFSKNYRKVIKSNKKINKIYLLAKVQNQIQNHDQDLNFLFNELNFSFEESEELLKYLLFNESQKFSKSFANEENWILILSLSHQIKTKYPALSKDNVFVYMGSNIYYFNTWIVNPNLVISQRPNEVLAEITPYMTEDDRTMFQVFLQSGVKWDLIKSKHLEFYDDFYGKFKYDKENELLAFSVWDLVIESSIICASPNSNTDLDLLLEDSSTKYLERLIYYRKDFNKKIPYFIESKIFEKNTTYFEDLNQKILVGRLFEEKQMHEQYAFLAVMYDEKGDTHMANRYIEKAINSSIVSWYLKAYYYYAKFNINWNIKPYGDKNGACHALEQALELWLENEEPDVLHMSKIVKEDILDALKGTCKRGIRNGKNSAKRIFRDWYYPAKWSEPHKAEVYVKETSIFGNLEMTEEGKISGEKLLETLAIQDSVQVKIEAVINSICQKRGAWMYVDLGKETEMLVRFKDYGFFVPIDATGDTAIIEGLAKIDTLSVEWLKHLKEDANASQEEIDAITEPKIIYSIAEATGVIIY